MNELIFWGVILSLALTELTGLSPGGIVVPAYFALYWGDPWRMALTVGISLLCMGGIRLLSRFMILYGRRRFALYLLLGMLLKLLFSALYARSPLDIPNLSLSIGYIIPGLLARDMERQGSIKTLLLLGVAVLILRLLQMALPGWGA